MVTTAGLRGPRSSDYSGASWPLNLLNQINSPSRDPTNAPGFKVTWSSNPVQSNQRFRSVPETQPEPDRSWQQAGQPRRPGPRARVLGPGTSASRAPLRYGTGSSPEALEGLAHPAPRSNPKANQPPPQGGQGTEHSQASLRTDQKLQVAQLLTEAPVGPRPLTQPSEAGRSDELHELAVAHVPQQALQAALAWKTRGAQARASSRAHTRRHGPGAGPRLGCPGLCGERPPTRAGAAGLVHRFTTWRWEHRGGTAERSF